jgi:hypothetical protein
MTAKDYLTVSNIAFIKPIHPGENPVHGNGATAAQITETNGANILPYTTYHTVENQLKTMLLEAVPNIFIQLVEDQRFGYFQLTTLQLLTHLDTTYGEVTNKDLANNLEQHALGSGHTYQRLVDPNLKSNQVCSIRQRHLRNNSSVVSSAKPNQHQTLYTGIQTMEGKNKSRADLPSVYEALRTSQH